MFRNSDFQRGLFEQGGAVILELLESEGIEYYSAPLLEEMCGVRVVFNNRRGGASGGPYESLNLSYNVGDEPGPVASNRQKVGGVLGVEPLDWVLSKPVHGTDVRLAGESDRGRGAFDYRSGLERCDGMVSSTRGIALGFLAADCATVVIVAPSRRAVSVAHAGWRGTLNGVVSKALCGLIEHTGCDGGEVQAFIGPHIGECCLEVDEGLARDFASRFEDSVKSKHGGPPRLSLLEACISQLESGGVDRANCHFTGGCTHCDKRYFSYRRAGRFTGRQASLVALL